MAKRNSRIIKSFRLSANTFDIIKEVADELCLAQNDIIRILLNRSTQQLKHDALRAGGYQNLSFSLEKIK